MLTLKDSCRMVIARNKKLKPQMTATVKNMDYTWTAGSEAPTNNQDVGIPRAVFIPHTNSLPFEERRVTLEEPVKIGRYVYRGSPCQTNTIFDCRVLSRHHATLYYDKGHFYLVDNQSSNGTYINNNRCSVVKDPHEVFSGDVVQFGIPVVENTANSEKNTFPPVVAMLMLYHPDGTEAKLHLNELYQLNNYVQEAIQREASLESRLRTLRECVERTRAEAQAAWELFVGEQRLLMRVHTLESMLAAGKHPDTQHVAQLLTDKKNYQEVALESLRTAHEQRLALEESLERRSREAAALQKHNCSLRLAANNALAELQKLAARCDRKMSAARLAISTAEERENTLRKRLPLSYSLQNGEAKMLVLSTDSNKLQDKRASSLEDAVRALPDYIKLLLPHPLLNKVGIKVIAADCKGGKDVDLILKKNDFNSTENNEKQQEEESVSSSGEKSSESNSGSDEEKSRINNDIDNEKANISDDEPADPVAADGELRPDNNANSTFSDGDGKEESPSKAGVEYANILRVMGGLNEEIKALRERLAASTAENEQLRNIRDDLLATTEAADPPETHDAAAYRATIADLQAQLTRSNVAEEANLAEIKRLASNAAEMQAELAFRPTRSDIDDLTAVVGNLQAEVLEKENLVKQLQAKPTLDKTTETSRSLEELRPEIDTKQISADIDEMFRLDYDDDDTDSVATEISNEKNVTSEYVRIDDEQRLQVTMQNGSLHALEEELVRAKERWEEISAEKARLAAQLATLQNKPMRIDITHLLALTVPILLACVFYALLPYIS
ncbi:sarcolemmal membrane-associated protein isoform X1 [Pieris rapae]|uniref:sarcolemmal membrane-associated protein isoform X1 n=1 Tax=Pieris rapae TaxID=64459 RepID=UPI000B92CD5C|nr:sarcolemmal membrane-associated protein isoform X1 [Pieris rapae]XP_022125370.1 sarcolemmal membrane-associated protein isoform X1 [Pieris rapae]XP_022125371.1 sarcolemmal membrane-associated protein isoform X1 [Pieris rapae]